MTLSQNTFEEEHNDTSNQYQDLRSKYNNLINTLFVRERLSSASEVKQLEQWLDGIRGDAKAISEAQQNFQRYAVPLMREQLTKKSQAEIDLQVALSNNEISKTSYSEWIAWMEDTGRSSEQKLSSIATSLPDYLGARRALARKRSAITRDSRLEQLAHSSDPKLKSLAAKITDTDYFLGTLSFGERETLIVEVLNALPLAGAELALFKEFETELNAAERTGLINGASVKKWIARFKNPGTNLQAKQYFVSQQFPSYVSNWRKVHEKRNGLLKDPAIKTMTTKDIAEIQTFLDNKSFVALHFDRKESLIAEIKAAITAKKTGKETLLSETKGVLQAAASAGYISKNKIGAWSQHVLDGKRTLAELKEFVKDWAKVRFRYDQIGVKMLEGKVPQGLQRLSEESFLALTYAQRVSYVEGVEQRLHMEKNQPKDTPIQDMKGKVRHALDMSNWEEAEHFLAKAWPMAESPEDIAELQSMEKYLRAFGKKSVVDKAEDGENADKEIAHANSELMRLMSLLPVGLQSIYRKALAKGADCLQCVTTTVYNRTWCQERSYLTEGLEERLRKKSIQETAERLSAAGEGHGDGAENAFVDGFHQPAIRDKGIGPQNVFLSAGGADAFVEKCDANKTCWSYWYWTNAIVNGVSAGQNAYVAYSLNHQFKRHARTLERHGKRFNPVGPLPSMN